MFYTVFNLKAPRQEGHLLFTSSPSVMSTGEHRVSQLTINIAIYILHFTHQALIII